MQGMGWKGISEISIWPYPTAQDVKAKFKLPNCGLTGDNRIMMRCMQQAE